MSASGRDSSRILFVTSNGTGLGHLTRSMAIARRLPESVEPLFITFSAGAPVVRAQGFAVEYIASYDRPGAGTDLSWTLRARDRLVAAVAEIQPSLVVFDGTHPYERLLPALRSTGAPLVWCRRGMWRPDADAAPLHRSHLFDYILEPGELDPGADRGPTAARRGEATTVAPIVLLDHGEQLDRELACDELGLKPDGRNVLVQLGQGNGVREATERCLTRLQSLPGVQAVALSSTLRTLGDLGDGVVRIDATYPIARYYRAFDASIAAAGYNVFHELIAMRVPTLFIPIERQTDDQLARAQSANAIGTGLAANGPFDPALESLIDELTGERGADRLRTALARVEAWDGARQAVGHLVELTGATSGAASNRVRTAPPAGVRLRRAAIFVRTVPRTVARIARQALTRPRLRRLVLALDLPAGEHDRLVAAELASSEDDPARTLVVTDRLEFGPLVQAGVGIEHIPADGERQAELAGGPYTQFRDRRLELIRARRPRPKRVISLETKRNPPVA